MGAGAREKFRVVVVTGMSGAGRSAALRALEDTGFYCVDNCPPKLVAALIDELRSQQGRTRVALGIDRRAAQTSSEIEEAIARLQASGCHVETVFLDCADQVLVRRYSETRRPHLLSTRGDLLFAIRKEREELTSLRDRADHVIDTSELSVHDLRRALAPFGDTGEKRPMHVKLTSFGFKYGMPTDANIVFDIRFLPNPFFDRELKDLSGLDERVIKFVKSQAGVSDFWPSFVSCVQLAMAGYQSEGKSYVTVAIGCTGGRHRSVVLIEELARILREKYDPIVVHRDIERG